MRRLALAMAVAACGHGGVRASESITVAPEPVTAPPLVVSGEAARPPAFEGAPIEIAIGGTMICVRLEGKVHCDADAPADAPVAAWPSLPGIDDAIDVSLGRIAGCVATRRGTVHCFGDNSHGQLGAGLRDERSDAPVQVLGVSGARRVVMGELHACAILDDETVRCWGDNQNGETGGTTSYAPAARELVRANAVPGVSGTIELALTYGSTCALAKSGDVRCWGTSIGPEQQKARGHNDETPFRVPSLAKTEDLAAGSGAFCAVRSDGVTCLGSSYALGTQTAIRGAAKVRVGGSHACVLTRDARVWCWGFNSGGELGREDEARHGYEPYAPAVVAGLPSVRDLAAGGSMSCAVASSDEVWCWGTWPYGGKRGARTERTPVRLPIR